jgi:3-hydroxyisobutyrate dehydrogenase-like beta-hydroxyacid dehydrogenase
MKIGFIGLGHMGNGMATSLLRAGRPRLGYRLIHQTRSVRVGDGKNGGRAAIPGKRACDPSPLNPQTRYLRGADARCIGAG